MPPHASRHDLTRESTARGSATDSRSADAGRAATAEPPEEPTGRACDCASITILLPRFMRPLVKSSVSSGTPGTSRKSSAGSKWRAIASNTRRRSRGFTSASTSTATLVSES